MEQKSYGSNVVLKSVIFSLIGVFAFFINMTWRGRTTVPMVHIMELIKEILTRENVNRIVLLSTIIVAIMATYVRFSPSENRFLSKYYKKEGLITYLMYIVAAIFAVMVIFGVGPAQILDPVVGNSSINVAGDVLVAIIVAGSLVAFLLEFGFFEFLGKLMEPIMRRVYKVPGKASVDALASFVASAAVGVMITNNLYKSNVYTEKEACSITTNFSVCSLGAFAFLSATVGVEHLYQKVVLSSMLLAFILAAIMVRVYPLSKKRDVYYDGRLQSEEERKPVNYHKGIIKEAVHEALSKAEGTPMSIIKDSAVSSVMFGLKVVSYVVSLSIISLLIANYTPIVQWIGKPIAPILSLFGLPDAQIIAPSTLVGIFGLAIPNVIIKGLGVAEISAFFVVVLSTSQVIFFTESANAMLESDMPLTFWDLVIIFFVRTAFLIPLTAVLARIVVGV